MMRKTKHSPAQTLAATTRAAQDWLPLADLHDGCMIRPDGGVVGGVAVSPISLALKSQGEVTSLIAAVHEAVNGMQAPWQMLAAWRPVDLDAYLTQLDATLANSDPGRKAVLRDYLAWVHGLVRSGQSVERRYYILVTRTGPDAVEVHRTSLRALADDLMRGPGFQARVMDDARWRELLFLTFHAGQAAYEQVPDGLRLPPVLREAGVQP